MHKEINDFKKLWIEKGLMHPLIYMKAIIGVSGGYFCPSYAVSVYGPVAQMYVYPGIDEFNNIGLSDDHRTDVLRNTIKECYSWLSYVPGINLIMYMVLYAWWIPLFVTFIILKKRDRNTLICLFPVLVAVAGLFMSPYASTRYIIPQFYSLPMLLAFITCDSRN